MARPKVSRLQPWLSWKSIPSLRRLSLESLIGKTKLHSGYTLNGGLLILKPDAIAMVATDGHRLVLAETTQKLAEFSKVRRLRRGLGPNQ